MKNFLKRFPLILNRKTAGDFFTAFVGKRQQGVGLMEIMVALAIAGILMAFMSESLKTAFRGSKSVSLKTDLEAIKRTVLSRVSCVKSFTTSTCATAGQLVQLKDSSDNVIISGSGAGTKFGDWTVRAECSADKDGIFMRAVRLRSGGTLTSTASSDFIPDPLTNSSVTWADTHSLLFPANTYICPTGAEVAARVPMPARESYASVSNGPGTWSCTAGQCAGSDGRIFGIYTKSPDEICVDRGYRYATGSCYIANVATPLTGSAIGTLYSNSTIYSPVRLWAITCLYGSLGNSVPDEITCVR